jgi:hypothetical protein
MRRIAFAFLLAAALPASAGRLEVIARAGEQRISGAEACFYAAGEDDDGAPLKRYLSYAQTTCLPADKVLRLPAGRWNLFVRAEGRVSAHPFVITVPPSAPSGGLQTLLVDLLPAARLDFTQLAAGLKEGEVAGAYFDNDGQAESVAGARPLASGETSLLVPAGMTVLPLVVRGGVPVRIGRPLLLRHGDAVAATVERDVCCDVIARVMLDPAERRQLVGSKATSPRLALINPRAEAVAPSIASTGRPTPMFDEGLAVFEHVPPGRYTLRLEGADWRSDEMSIDVEAKNGITAIAAKRSLVARQGSAITVRWSIDPVALAPAPSCESDSEQPPIALRLFRCPTAGDEARYATTCRVVESATLPGRGEDAKTFAVGPGEYVAELRINSLVASAAARNGEAFVAIKPTVLRGTVRRSGEGIRALLQFRSGAAVTDEFGRYAAALMRLPVFSPIVVQPCDGSPIYREVPRQKLSEGESYDIDIPTNELRVRVINAVTRLPVERVHVYAAPLGGETGDLEPFFEDMSPTDASGATAAKQLAFDTPLHVCATAERYVAQCTETFVLDRTAQKDVTIALQPRAGPQGQITAGAPFLNGLLFVVAGGRSVEEAAVAEDGSFVLRHDHPDPVIVAVASANNPLAVLTLRRQNEMLLGTMPRRRDVEVSLAPDSATPSAAIGLIIDGTVLPRNVILAHFPSRHVPTILRRGETVTVRDVSGSIVVLLGSDVAPPPYPPVDPFGIPALVASMRSAPVDANGRAAFR